MFFFFSSRRRHTRCSRDWSSDVCSSDLGLVQRQGVHARLASEPRASVYFSRARTALSCFAVPANCQVGSEVALDVVQGIQNDHARGNGHTVIGGLPAGSFTAKNAQGGFPHGRASCFARSIATSQRNGTSDPATFHLMNLVEPISGARAFMTRECGIRTVKSIKDFSSSHADMVQKFLSRGFARRA